MISVRLTEQMVVRARQYQRKVSETATLRGTENYTGLSVQDRYFHGHLGELAVVKLLGWHGKRYAYKPAADGQPDGGDVTVFVADRGLQVDIKTATRPTHRCLMIPEAQFAKRHRDLYLGARLDLESMRCEVHGTATRSIMEKALRVEPPKLNVKIVTRMTMLSDLLQAEDWLSSLDDARTL